MPLKQLTVCAECEGKTCDGAMWLWVGITENGKAVNMNTIPEENKGPKCSSSVGRAKTKALKGKAIGDEVTLFFPNWVTPAYLTLRKVAD